MLAAGSAAEDSAARTGGHAPDAGLAASARASDGGTPRAASHADAGPCFSPNVTDLEVVDNLELLELLPEREVLDVLLPWTDS